MGAAPANPGGSQNQPEYGVCLVCGSMIMIEDWAEKIRRCSMPGIRHGRWRGSGADLFGDVNPSGKLPSASLPASSTCRISAITDKEITYDLYHGYTLLERSGAPGLPVWSRLSYTTFKYSDVKAGLRTHDLEITFKVANTGERDGEEVAQFTSGWSYSRIDGQRSCMKGFEKVSIPAGKTVV